MNNLNLILKSLLCLILIQLVSACSEDDTKRTRPAIYRVVDDPDVSDEVNSKLLTGSVSGTVLGNFRNIENDDLNFSAKAFATAFLEPEHPELGHVSSVLQDVSQAGKTGVRFVINICMNNSSINFDSNTQVSKDSAALKIYIKDSYAAQGDETYGVPSTQNYKLISSSLRNKQLTLVFENAFGKIELVGSNQEDADFYVGRMDFDNSVDSHTGGIPYEGTLGLFYIPVKNISRNCR